VELLQVGVGELALRRVSGRAIDTVLVEQLEQGVHVALLGVRDIAKDAQAPQVVQGAIHVTSELLLFQHEDEIGAFGVVDLFKREVVQGPSLTSAISSSPRTALRQCAANGQ